jgi:HD-GYP domain-containing protein (c-di-GMP phosphodiesterase class II)
MSIDSIDIENRAELGARRSGLRTLAVDGVARWFDGVRRHLRPVNFESMQALLAAVDAKDPYTRMHSLNVAVYADAIGRRLRLPSQTLRTLQAAALLHDVGKIGVPDAILNKPAPLTLEEFDAVRRHPQIALDILGPMRCLTSHRPMILYHHERYDGFGYPGGIAGEHIPIGARILAVADAVDTMLSPRTYKQAYCLDEVRAELIASAGRQFDPHIVGMTLEWLDETRPNVCPPAFATDE